MVRPHFQREGARDLEDKENTLTEHQTEEIKILWAYKKKGKHFDNSIRGESRRQTTKRQTSQHLVC